jgi:hypothetical protein
MTTTLVADPALIRHNNNVAVRRVAHLHQYFSVDYQKPKDRNYLQAVQAAEGGLSGQFGEGCKISQRV